MVKVERKHVIYSNRLLETGKIKMPPLIQGYNWRFFSDSSGSSWIGLQLEGIDTDFRAPLPMPETLDEDEQSKIIVRAAMSVKFSLATAILENMSSDVFDDCDDVDNIIHAADRFKR